MLYEYPRAFEGDPANFIDVITALASPRTDPSLFIFFFFVLNHVCFKQLLSQLKCHTSNVQFLQWLLALRSFALVSFSTAVLNFYRNMRESDAVSGEINTLQSS